MLCVFRCVSTTCPPDFSERGFKKPEKSGSRPHQKNRQLLEKKQLTERNCCKFNCIGFGVFT